MFKAELPNHVYICESPFRRTSIDIFEPIVDTSKRQHNVENVCVNGMCKWALSLVAIYHFNMFFGSWLVVLDADITI